MGDTAADLAAIAGAASSNSKQTVRDIIMLLFGSLCVVLCEKCEVSLGEVPSGSAERAHPKMWNLSRRLALDYYHFITTVAPPFD